MTRRPRGTPQARRMTLNKRRRGLECHSEPAAHNSLRCTARVHQKRLSSGSNHRRFCSSRCQIVRDAGETDRNFNAPLRKMSTDVKASAAAVANTPPWMPRIPRRAQGNDRYERLCTTHQHRNRRNFQVVSETFWNMETTLTSGPVLFVPRLQRNPPAATEPGSPSAGVTRRRRPISCLSACRGSRLPGAPALRNSQRKLLRFPPQPHWFRRPMTDSPGCDFGCSCACSSNRAARSRPGRRRE